MNYITELNAFYDFLLSNPLSTGQIALWQALMHINNKCAWAEWFTVPNQTLQLLTGLSRDGVNKSRNALKQVGLIDFVPNGTKTTRYMVKSLQDRIQNSSQNSSALNKLNETKRNKTFKERLPAEAKRERFTKPSVEEIGAYCAERQNRIDPQRFYDFYEARGWMAGKVRMKDWKAAVRTWEQRKQEPPCGGYEGVNEL